MKTYLNYIAIAVALLLVCSCNGIFAWIYDVEQEEVEAGITEGSIYACVTSYTQWICVNFRTQQLDTVAIASDGTFEDPIDWDIALHRWDVRTNGGAALETSYTSLEDLQAATEFPSGDFVEDIWTESQIIIDMSGMMEGVLGYAPSYYNTELSKWMDVDTSGMPPSYTPSYKVYLLRLADETIVALRLANYTNANGVKGYLTIEYVYPFSI